MSELSAQARIAAIWKAVRAIPQGQTRSYAEVGRMAGLPRGARQVVAALRQSDGELPWHRVVRADGRIAFPEDSESYGEQVRRLRNEGVRVESGRVLERRRRSGRSSGAADLDAAIWAPPGAVRR